MLVVLLFVTGRGKEVKLKSGCVLRGFRRCLTEKKKERKIKERQKMLIGKGGLNLFCDLHYKE